MLKNRHNLQALKGARILVTGGAGFIGSHLVDKLAPENEVFVVDNLFTGKLSNLEKSKHRITFINGDIRDKALMKDVVGKVSFVFHMAADVGNVRSIEDPFTNMDVNVRGTLNLLEACLTSNIVRLVYSASSAAYGEAKYLPINEDHPINPESPYAVSKLAAEKYIYAFYKIHGLPATCLRYFNVYGPRQESSEYSNVIPIFFKRIIEGKPLTIFGDGGQTRDFTYIADIVRANVLAATHPQAIGGIFNVATGRQNSVNELANLVKQVTGKEFGIIHEKARVGEVRDSLANIEKVKKILGFNPEIDLKEGLALTWQERRIE